MYLYGAEICLRVVQGAMPPHGIIPMARRLNINPAERMGSHIRTLWFENENIIGMEEAMYGDITEVAENTVMVEGKMPSNILKEPDIANALVYKSGETVYCVDTGATLFFRDRLKKAIEGFRPFRRLVLLNSHAHPDHTPNNVIIQEIEAEEKAHYISKKALPELDFMNSFTKNFKKIGGYYDLLDGPRFPYSLVMRPLKLFRLFRFDPFFLILKNSLNKFGPHEVSRDTMVFFESQPPSAMPIQSAEWTGWNIDDDVLALEARGHTPDEIIFYFPKTKVLMPADETVKFFNSWPRSNAAVIKEVLRKSLRMIETGEVEILVDAHSHDFFSGEKAAALLKERLDDYEAFTRIIHEILKAHPQGLTVNAIYKKVRGLKHSPVTEKYLAYEFPQMPGFLKTVITLLMLEKGGRVDGPEGKKMFFPDEAVF